jgi:hypothetical protein
MAQEIGKTFTGRVVIDENSYRDCVFSGANMVYYGGQPPAFESCTFERCQWTFNSSAGHTVAFLRTMAHSDTGFRNLFEEIFANKPAAAAPDAPPEPAPDAPSD